MSLKSLAALLLIAASPSCGGPPKRDAASVSSARPRQPPAPNAREVGRAELCVSAGRVEAGHGSHLHVDSGGMRALVAGDASEAAELDFTYRGPSAQTIPLASGELRRQIGVKLRAKDTCNVVYVMWHVGPNPGIAVSVKHNPTASTHAACGDQGYIHLRPSTSAPAPRVRPNESHALRAEIDGHILHVLVDGAAVWTGSLPAEASTFAGPAGVRSDNGAFDFDLRVVQPKRAGAECAGH